jgi:hypothetical protein
VGLVFDGEGRAMTPSHATKPGKRYRYYVTRPDQLDESPAWRVSAHDLERLVCERLSDLLTISSSLRSRAKFSIQRSSARLTSWQLIAQWISAEQRLLATRSLASISHEGIDVTVGDPSWKRAGAGGHSRHIQAQLILTLLNKVQGHQLRLVIPGPQAMAIAGQPA